jgi:TetR/AcrR family transcriptional repressor of nem operon
MSDKGIRTRRNITEKSLQLFSVKGYFNTSINDILKATDLTKGGLYGHFGSKEDIWHAVYAEAVKIWRGIVFNNVRGISDPLDRIEKAIENHEQTDLTGFCKVLEIVAILAGRSRWARPPERWFEL